MEGENNSGGLPQPQCFYKQRQRRAWRSYFLQDTAIISADRVESKTGQSPSLRKTVPIYRGATRRATRQCR